MALNFEGRVAVITGAGAGLGRAYALLLASRGARVVVNDLGGSKSGVGADKSAADKVVDEIKARGGVAVADYHSVEDGDAIVKTAIDNFGRIDILVNNAGILRDGTFQKMTPEQWDLVMRVHLHGTFKTTRAAWNYMKDQGFGRIVMVSSSSGIFGNFGQSNYAAAKMAVVGLANTLAREGVKRNIVVNTIAPAAASRMTQDLMPPDVLAVLKPEYVAPIVAYLCHESCTTTGALYEMGGGYFTALRWQRSQGAFCDKDGEVTPESVRDSWAKICDFTNPTYPDSTQSSFEPIMARALAAKAEVAESYPKSDDVDPKLIMAQTLKPADFVYTARDAIIYALSVGASDEALNPDDLRFTYELHPEGLKVLPTFAVLFGFGSMAGIMEMPGLKFNPMMLLHGEQYVSIRNPLALSGTISNTAKVTGVYDKGKGVVLQIDTVSKDEKGAEVAFARSSVFIRGIGGYGGDRGPKADDWKLPSSPPQATESYKTSSNQALWYRLNGDPNPLHADPQMAAMGGFDKPILHGLCSFGIAGRAILKAFCDSDPANFKSIKARFTSHVFPGETVVTEMWKQGSSVLFQCKVAERGTTVLSGGVVELAASPVAKL